ncbi:MAG: glycosyltransferase family 4 protein [Pseudomonadales bacterium]|nr:glycosyltransferase family 4 protein [Pseudomonadales bacterium]
MIRVAALTHGALVPSARYRVRQNIQSLKQHNIDVTEFLSPIDPDKPVPFNITTLPRVFRLPFTAAWQGLKVGSRLPQTHRTKKYDATWLQRPLLPAYMTLEKMLKRPVIFDVDDAIWLSRPSSKQSTADIAKLSSVVVAGNQYIGDWFSNHNDNVQIVPTGVDINKFIPSENTASNRFTIGWIGTRTNLRYLEEIEQALSEFFKKYSDAQLLVVSDGVPNFKKIPKENINVVAWSKATEIEDIQKMNIGLMPLPDNEWTKGKCSFKMLQYMACGIPVVVAPVGMNSEVFGMGEIGYAARNNHEWFDAFECLYNSSTLAREMGKQGRAVIAANFSTDIVSLKLAEIFRMNV